MDTKTDFSLTQDIVKRIQRLPKPKNAAMALQPLFEAIMNSIHSTQEKFGKEVSEKGVIDVRVKNIDIRDSLEIVIKDNGYGLNAKNWDAFKTTDTDNKIRKGGKGVGRLLWLDCFKNIKIDTVFENDDGKKKRVFDFVLNANNQIQNYKENSITEAVPGDYFSVIFSGLRNNGYCEKFPAKEKTIFQHIISHFLPNWIEEKCPKLNFTYDNATELFNETKTLPEGIKEVVKRKNIENLNTKDYSNLNLTLLECSKDVSSNLPGSNFVYFIAHDRTVLSRCIDTKLGFKTFGEDRVFHAMVTGEYLDKNVNQERTSFNFEDKNIDEIINKECFEKIEEFLQEAITERRQKQQKSIKDITDTYPSVNFDNIEELQKKVPVGETSEDAIYAALARERFRRDRKQAEKIKKIMSSLRGDKVNGSDLETVLKTAKNAIEDTEQRSLAEYVVRRKVILDFMDILLEKTRVDTKDSAYQREELLHSFICPVKTSSLDNNTQACSHDLWIIDERLTFAQYFSSDMSFKQLTGNIDNAERPDLLIFDHIHALRKTNESSEVLSNILLIEFKRPGLKSYEESPDKQVQRYIRQLQKGKIQDIKGRPIQINENTIFHCFIIADIIGNLEEDTYSWQRTADGRGRIYVPNGGYKGEIQLMGWDALLKDAKQRNNAFFEKVGITGKSFFSNN